MANGKMSMEKKFARVRKEVRKDDPEKVRLQQELEATKLKLAESDEQIKVLKFRFLTAGEEMMRTQQELAEYKQAAREHKEMSETDPLTGLLNKRGFETQAKTLFEGVPRARTDGPEEVQVGFNVIFIDLNDFKPINDKFSHAAGDMALQKVAEALRSKIRKGSLVARYGGDEFVVAFLSKESQKGGVVETNRVIVAERIRQAMEDSGFVFKDKAVRALTASIGAAKEKPGETLEELVHRADLLVYKAKEKKKEEKEAAKERVTQRLASELGREPSEDEVAAEMENEPRSSFVVIDDIEEEESGGQKKSV